MGNLTTKLVKVIQNSNGTEIYYALALTKDVASMVGGKIVNSVKDITNNIAYEIDEAKRRKRQAELDMKYALELKLEMSWEQNIKKVNEQVNSLLDNELTEKNIDNICKVLDLDIEVLMKRYAKEK